MSSQYLKIGRFNISQIIRVKREICPGLFNCAGSPRKTSKVIGMPTPSTPPRSVRLISGFSHGRYLHLLNGYPGSERPGPGKKLVSFARARRPPKYTSKDAGKERLCESIVVLRCSCVSSETPLLSLWMCNGIGRTDVCFVLYSTATVQSVSDFV